MLVELSVMEQRNHAVMEAISGAPVAEVARRYGLSRQAVHGWLGRYELEGRGAPRHVSLADTTVIAAVEVAGSSVLRRAMKSNLISIHATTVKTGTRRSSVVN